MPRLVDASQNHCSGGNMVDSDYESYTSKDSGESNWFDVRIPTGCNCGQLIVARIKPYDIQVRVPCPDQGDRSQIWVHIPPTVVPTIEELNKKASFHRRSILGSKCHCQTLQVLKVMTVCLRPSLLSPLILALFLRHKEIPFPRHKALQFLRYKLLL
jgi:hypothetical protein